MHKDDLDIYGGSKSTKQIEMKINGISHFKWMVWQCSILSDNKLYVLKGTWLHVKQLFKMSNTFRSIENEQKQANNQIDVLLV